MSRRRGGPAAPGPSQRQLRAAELVRHALVEVLAREAFRDPELANARVTVGEVRASADLKHMTVFVAPLGGGDAEALAAALNRASAFLRGRLGRAVELRYTPDLHFIPDVSYEEASRIGRLLHRPDVARDLGPKDEEDED